MDRENMTQLILTGEKSAIQNLKTRISSSAVRTHLIPTIEFKKCILSKDERQALTQLPSYDYLFFTSVRAVQYFVDALLEYHIELIGVAVPSVVAVGPMTASACRKAGLRVVSTPSHFTADHMIKNLLSLSSKKILFPRSTIAPEDTIVSINNSGAKVTQLSLYSTTYRTEALNEADKTALTTADYVIFLSPSSVKSFMNLVSNSTLTDVLHTATALCIGPRTEHTARALGFEHIIVTKEFTTGGVIDTLTTLV